MTRNVCLYQCWRPPKHHLWVRWKNTPDVVPVIVLGATFPPVPVDTPLLVTCSVPPSERATRGHRDVAPGDRFPDNARERGADNVRCPCSSKCPVPVIIKVFVPRVTACRLAIGLLLPALRVTLVLPMVTAFLKSWPAAAVVVMLALMAVMPLAAVVPLVVRLSMRSPLR